MKRTLSQQWRENIVRYANRRWNSPYIYAGMGLFLTAEQALLSIIIRGVSLSEAILTTDGFILGLGFSWLLLAVRAFEHRRLAQIIKRQRTRIAELERNEAEIALKTYSL